MDEKLALYDEDRDATRRLSEGEQMLRTVLIVGCALGVILGLAFASLLTP